MSLNVEQLRLFFQANERIKSVAWCFELSDFDVYDAIHWNACRLSTMLWIWGICLFQSTMKRWRDSFSEICSYLRVLCDRDSFKCLEIAFERKYGTEALVSCASQLSGLKQLTKIHLKGVRIACRLWSQHYNRWLIWKPLSWMFRGLITTIGTIAAGISFKSKFNWKHAQVTTEYSVLYISGCLRKGGAIWKEFYCLIRITSLLLLNWIAKEKIWSMQHRSQFSKATKPQISILHW